MIKLTDFSHQELSRYLSTYQETALSLKIDINSHKDLPLVEIIQKELGKLNHLKELNLIVPKNTILSEKGYSQISNAVINLNQLNRLSIIIGVSCSLSNKGFSIIKDMISHLPQLIYLKLQIQKNNYISAEPAKEFLDSLTKKQNLTTLKINFEHIQNAQINNRDFHFWRGLSNLTNLEKLVLKFNHSNYNQSDLFELFESIVNLKKLAHLSVVLFGDLRGMNLLIGFFSFLGKKVELKSLKIDFDSKLIALKEDQRKEIIRNLKNLQLIEKLELDQLGEHLFQNHYEEYLNLIQSFKYLKVLSLESRYAQKLSRDKMILLNQCLMQLKCMQKLDLVLKDQRHISFPSNFFQDLQAAFHEMQNLQELQLQFSEELGQLGCNALGESFVDLSCLRRLKLQLIFRSHFIQDSGQTKLFNNIIFLTSLKDLEITIIDSSFEETLLFDSISKLSSLENLYMEKLQIYGINCGFQNVEGLSNSLANLKKLKSLKFNMFIPNVSRNYSELSKLQQSFKYLEDLEDLYINFNISYKNKDFQDISLIQYLTKLKRLEIRFENVPINIFGIPNNFSDGNKTKIEKCILDTFVKIQTEDFVQIMESLSNYIVDCLELNLNLTNHTSCLKEFQLACSKFRNLTKLKISDKSYYQSELFYTSGIKEMKSLNKLKLILSNYILKYKDISLLDETLTNLLNLSKLEIQLPNTQVFHDLFERLQQNSLKQLDKFKKIFLLITLSKLDKDETEQLYSQYFDLHNALSLYEQDNPSIKLTEYQKIQNSQIHQVDQVDKIDQLDQVTLDKIGQVDKIDQLDQVDKSDQVNEITDDSTKNRDCLTQQQESSVENKQYLQIETNCYYQPVELLVDIIQSEGEDQITLIKYLDSCDLQYLNDLSIQCCQQYDRSVQLKMEQQLFSDNFRNSRNLNRLISISIFLDYLILSEEQIICFSEMVKQQLMNLEYLCLQTQTFQEYYSIIFDSFKHLINLSSLLILTNISENGAVSLGNSLRIIKILQKCELIFYDENTLGTNGFSSIFRGIKENNKLRELSLQWIISQDLDEDCQFIIYESVSNLKLLEILTLNFTLNDLNEKKQLIFSRQLMSSIGSFVHLSELHIKISEENPFNQEMLDELVGSLNSLQFLSKITISIHLQDDSPIKISREFAKIFNIDQNSKLSILTKKNLVEIKQNQYSIVLISLTMKNLEMDFLEYLDERKQIYFEITQSRILSNINKCNSKKIVLDLERFDFEEGELVQVSEFISRLQNVFELNITFQFDNEINNLETELFKLAQNITKLKGLKVLYLKVNFEVEKSLLIKMLNIIKSMQQLQDLYLNAKDFEINIEMIPLIQRSILRLVKFHQPVQKGIFY